jgi:spermidine synthase
MGVRWLFLGAYACSGLAGLIYEVSWTRLLALHLGHTTAAVSTVVGAFMGGLAGGSALGGLIAPRLTRKQALYGYALLESLVALVALALPYELFALKPLLAWAYQDGAPGVLFSIIRLLSCLALLLMPALALGATFPLAVRWFIDDDVKHAGRAGGRLYAANTAGAAVGATAAGFVLIPAIGVSGTSLVGVAGSALAVVSVLVLARQDRSERELPPQGPAKRAKTGTTAPAQARHHERQWLAAAVLGLTGFATLIYEIGWTRVLSLIVGPTTYAFATTVTVLIAGLACGSVLGSVVAGRTRRPAFWLALALTTTAILASYAAWLAGGAVPRRIAEEIARSPYSPDALLMRHVTLAAALILPSTLGLGFAFPLGLELAGSGAAAIARRFGLLYAVNTFAAVAGALVAGFVFIPLVGLEQTLRLVSALLILAALVAALWGGLSPRARVIAALPAAVAVAMLIWSPPWDRELLASGAYMYAPDVPAHLELEPALKAGTLVYYRDGAASTVSVKQLTGTLSLTIDGKVDASNFGDMLTQKVLAHLPLLLHPRPRDVAIIGLGSGVTLAAALLHPVARADVVEISPEVVEASRFFAVENRNALADPHTRLILGDGRSHLRLSARKYDVIISEPSNPWMAGVAALFTREFFAAARDRLAPGGIICQWAHVYDISDGDLRSIVATFASVFPEGTMWLIGESDLLLIASTVPLDGALSNFEAEWQRRSAVTADLRDVAALEPFALWSMFIGGPRELQQYTGNASMQTDDRMALEFSGPRALHNRSAAENASRLLRLFLPNTAPPPVRQARAAAGAPQWRNRAAMLLRAGDYKTAYEDYLRALTLNPTDVIALDGFVRAAVATRRETQAIDRLKAADRDAASPAIWLRASKLLAAAGRVQEAVAMAREASAIDAIEMQALEQLASVFADLGDAGQLEPVAAQLRSEYPDRASGHYYAAASRFLRSEFAEALSLAQQAVALNPSYSQAQNLIGAIHANLGEHAAAREAFEAALRFDPRDSATYTNLGLLELTSGNRAIAAAYFSEALSLDPASVPAQRGLAQARERTNSRRD